MLVTDPDSPDFESYASVDDLRVLATSRGYEVPADDSACKKLLLQGMDYLAGLIWKGSRSVAEQPLFWPRSGLWSTVTYCLKTLSQNRLYRLNADWRLKRR